MKKKSLIKKLQLGKQTIVTLQDNETGDIKGGTIYIPPITTPPTHTYCSNCLTQCAGCMSGVPTCP